MRGTLSAALRPLAWVRRMGAAWPSVGAMEQPAEVVVVGNAGVDTNVYLDGPLDLAQRDGVPRGPRHGRAVRRLLGARLRPARPPHGVPRVRRRRRPRALPARRAGGRRGGRLARPRRPRRDRPQRQPDEPGRAPARLLRRQVARVARARPGGLAARPGRRAAGALRDPGLGPRGCSGRHGRPAPSCRWTCRTCATSPTRTARTSSPPPTCSSCPGPSWPTRGPRWPPSAPGPGRGLRHGCARLPGRRRQRSARLRPGRPRRARRRHQRRRRLARGRVPHRVRARGPPPRRGRAARSAGGTLVLHAARHLTRPDHRRPSSTASPTPNAPSPGLRWQGVKLGALPPQMRATQRPGAPRTWPANPVRS